MLLRGLRKVTPNLYYKFVKELGCNVRRNFSSSINNVPVATFRNKCYQPWTCSAIVSSRSFHENSSKQFHLNLMDFKQQYFPSFLKYFKNVFMVLLIRTFDNKFSGQTFLDGAEQAVSAVSSSISSGDFDSLNGLVTEEAIKEIKGNYEKMTPEQKNFIAVNSKDLFIRLIYEIGMITENADRRFIEITTIIQGFHGLEHVRDKSMEELVGAMAKSPEQFYVCNYRFIREYTKGMEGSWTINKLNHWQPKITVKK